MKTFYCDGSTRGKNQCGVENKGGWGVVCFDEEDDTYFCFDCAINDNTTNNREELKALIYSLSTALEIYPDEKCIIYSDSAYVVNIVNLWIDNWARNGWYNSKKKKVENLDLILELHNILSQFFVRPDVRKCEGHAGEIGNELADALATSNLKRFLRLIDEYKIELSPADYEWIQQKMEEE